VTNWPGCKMWSCNNIIFKCDGLKTQKI